ncbi:hypothetical protein GQ53DRAFT_814645 [Thozetella sp. PMI_491]|nr:hypothetical protein GQ53DRAFT_814645 [Thozetella sp. PMI_491]
MYLNPEFDYFEMDITGSTKEIFPKFLHDLKVVFDPLHVGLLNLAIGLHTLNSRGFTRFSLADLDTEAGPAFVATLAQLRGVFFVFMPSAGRQNYGLQSGLGLRRKFYNLSFPIMTRTPVFERRLDPRPVAKDLGSIYVGDADPRVMVRQWHQLPEFRDFRAPHPAPVSFCFRAS